MVDYEDTRIGTGTGSGLAGSDNTEYGSSTTGAGNTGYGGSNTSGPHSSGYENKLDPRVDSGKMLNQPLSFAQAD